jgi:hypothetical protein
MPLLVEEPTHGQVGDGAWGHCRRPFVIGPVGISTQLSDDWKDSYLSGKKVAVNVGIIVKCKMLMLREAVAVGSLESKAICTDCGLLSANQPKGARSPCEASDIATKTDGLDLCARVIKILSGLHLG